ncbi:MAG: hypothetical protein IPL61_12620 [Myxococcales bacterium]|nr:hypothetical protein [Myxococcales bacterium]
MTITDILRHAIYAAFRSPPPPPGALVLAGADPGEALHVRRTFRKRRWTAVERTAPRTAGSALAWLTPPGRRHYLPLWLVAALHDRTPRASAVFHVARIAEPAQHAELALYTPAERAAVAAVLHWIASDDPVLAEDAARALPAWRASIASPHHGA